jgi:hypothetical protein
MVKIYLICIIVLVGVLSCTPPPAQDWQYRPYNREIDPSEYEAVRSPYYGQWWRCVRSVDMMIEVDTVEVKHVRLNGLLPMEGPYKPCDSMRRVR